MRLHPNYRVSSGLIPAWNKHKAPDELPNLFLLTKPLIPGDSICEIYSYKNFRKHEDLGYSLLVIGLARGRAEAEELLSRILEENFQKTGGFLLYEKGALFEGEGL